MRSVWMNTLFVISVALSVCMSADAFDLKKIAKSSEIDNNHKTAGADNSVSLDNSILPLNINL